MYSVLCTGQYISPDLLEFYIILTKDPNKQNTHENTHENIDTMIFLHSQCFDPEEILHSMPKLQNKSPTPQTESQYIPTQIKTVNSPTLPMTKECRKGATKYLKCNAKSRANPTQMCPCLQTINQRWAGTFEKYNAPHTPIRALDKKNNHIAQDENHKYGGKEEEKGKQKQKKQKTDQTQR